MSEYMPLDQAFAIANKERAPYYMVLLYAVALTQHDWHYAYSDDHGVWSRGERNITRLEQMEKAIAQWGGRWENMAKGYRADICPWIAAPESLPKDEHAAALGKRERLATALSLSAPVIIDIVASLAKESAKKAS